MCHYSYNKPIWDYILADGIRFCHWGGKDISNKIIELLDIKKMDSLLDLCCGGAGTLSALKEKPKISCGIDIDFSILKYAANNKKDYLIQADALNLPFRDNSFNKILMQDADAWLLPNKLELVQEIFRVLDFDGKIIIQTYTLSNKDLDEEVIFKTSYLLKSLGYNYNSIISLNQIKNILEHVGFGILATESLHQIYIEDNLQMIDNLEKLKTVDLFEEKEIFELSNLLYWEKYLFSQGILTGVLIIANK